MNSLQNTFHQNLLVFLELHKKSLDGDLGEKDIAKKEKLELDLDWKGLVQFINGYYYHKHLQNFPPIPKKDMRYVKFLHKVFDYKFWFEHEHCPDASRLNQSFFEAGITRNIKQVLTRGIRPENPQELRQGLALYLYKQTKPVIWRSDKAEKVIWEAIEKLPREQAAIIRCKHGLISRKYYEDKKLSDMFNLTEDEIRVLEKIALVTLSKEPHRTPLLSLFILDTRE